MPPTPPTSSPSTPPADPGSDRRVTGTVLSPWNLLLLLPLVMLVTPWFNRTDPKLVGLPFFYWFQFACVILGVACVWIVYATTRRKPVNTLSADRLSVDDLDEGGRA
jgi:Protein of unknown function (DUF3311)